MNVLGPKKLWLWETEDSDAAHIIFYSEEEVVHLYGAFLKPPALSNKGTLFWAKISAKELLSIC